MTLSRVLANAGIFLISCVAAIAIGEGVLRIVFDPADHLRIDRLFDPVLGHRIPSGVKGHDANGFRNPEVPDSVDILAVGDSMTYGWAAAATDSWPAQLAALTGKSVYNAGMGAYGPLQYLHLVRTLAPELAPKRIVVMLLPTNDLFDAYNLAYFLEHWRDYRDPAATTAGLDVFLHPLRWKVETATPRRLGWRDRFPGYATLWRLFNERSSLLHEFRARRHRRLEREFAVTHLDRSFFLRMGRGEFRHIAADDPKIVEGMAIAKRALSEIAAFCAERNIGLHVAVMPNRVEVLYPFVRDQLTEPQDKRMTTFIGRLQSVTSELIDFLRAEGIPHTYLYDSMIEASEGGVLYPAVDSHPNGNGYRAVAEALADALSDEGRD